MKRFGREELEVSDLISGRKLQFGASLAALSAIRRIEE
jgi:hypothetical protein